MNRFVTMTAAVAGLLAPARAAAQQHHLHQAVHDIRGAIAEVEGAKHTHFDRHKEQALKDLRHALVQVDRALEAAGDPFPKNVAVKPDLYRDYKDHRHLRHAEHSIDAAIRQLCESKANFGEHRAHAVKALEAAHHQVKLLIRDLR